MWFPDASAIPGVLGAWREAAMESTSWAQRARSGEKCGLAAMLLLLVACGTDSGDAPDGGNLCDGPPIVEVGSDERDFVRLSDDDTVPIVRGPQGWHIYGSVRTANLGETVRIHFNLTLADSGEELYDTVFHAGLSMYPDHCTGFIAGIIGYLDVDDVPELPDQWVLSTMDIATVNATYEPRSSATVRVQAICTEISDCPDGSQDVPGRHPQ